MNITYITKEYPPNIYGGAGIHIDYLSKEVAKLEDRRHRVRVFCFGRQSQTERNLSIRGIGGEFQISSADPRHRRFLMAALNNLVISGLRDAPDIIHCHTWYTLLAGCLLKQFSNAPLVLTTHSLELQRPWKADQLGSAYRATVWLEKVAYQEADKVIAVSKFMKESATKLMKIPREKIEVIYNGVDQYKFRKSPDPSILKKYRIPDDLPYVLHIGRLTRQKGITHLVQAVKYLKTRSRIVIVAGEPDSQSVLRKISQDIKRSNARNQTQITFVPKTISQDEVVALNSRAAVFVCPSIYEPLGMVNLEAMACEVPVVASKVGGIAEIVEHGKTGILVPFKARKNAEPMSPDKFSQDLAFVIDRLLRSPSLSSRMGKAGRRRVIERYTWKKIAEQTLALYKNLLKTSLHNPK